MPHINNEPGEHDPTASAFIVRLDTPEPSIILHRHKKLNVFLHFGGHVEPVENPWEALRHEVLEESGYDFDQLRILQPPVRIKSLTGVIQLPIPINGISHPFEGLDHWHDNHDYAFVTDQTPRHSVADGESKDIQLFTAAEILTIPTEDIPENVREVCLFILKEALIHWEPIDWV